MITYSVARLRRVGRMVRILKKRRARNCPCVVTFDRVGMTGRLRQDGSIDDVRCLYCSPFAKGSYSPLGALFWHRASANSGTTLNGKLQLKLL